MAEADLPETVISYSADFPSASLGCHDILPSRTRTVLTRNGARQLDSLLNEMIATMVKSIEKQIISRTVHARLCVMKIWYKSNCALPPVSDYIITKSGDWQILPPGTVLRSHPPRHDSIPILCSDLLKSLIELLFLLPLRIRPELWIEDGHLLRLICFRKL